MPLKIRCPHCRRMLVAEDETAGQRKLCPACGEPFDVPLPAPEASPPPVDVAVRCRRCGAEVAPGTSVCRKCHTDVHTGKRLPALQRLRRASPRTVGIAALAVFAGGLLGYVAVHMYLARFQRKGAGPLVSAAAPQAPFIAAEWTARLLEAGDAEARRLAKEKLVLGVAQAGAEVPQSVVAALKDSLARGEQGRQVTRNRLAALDVLAQTARAGWVSADDLEAVLQAAERDAALRETAWRTRAMLGDASIAAELRRVWLDDVQRLVFLRRVAEVSGSGDQPAGRLVIGQTHRRVARAADGLRRLATYDEPGVLDSMLAHYWESWSWLGQYRGAVLAVELFELAKPAETTRGAARDFEAEKQAIRKARDALQRAGRRAPPTVAAAAGLVLAEAAPQYVSARDRIVRRLAAALPDCSPHDQQRVAWAIARLTGRQFGLATARRQPAAFERADVEAVLRWASASGLTRPAQLPVTTEAYAVPIRLSYRVVPPALQLERDLLRQLDEGWAAAVLHRWLEADLGCSPRLMAHLDPGQRQPHYPALAAAMVMVADCNEQGARRELSLWREALDQPAWVRQLAYMVLGALDARAGRRDSGWPAGFELPPPEQLDRGQPGWHHFACVLAAGGPTMMARWQALDSPALPGELLAKLVNMATEVMRRREYQAMP